MNVKCYFQSSLTICVLLHVLLKKVLIMLDIKEANICLKVCVPLNFKIKIIVWKKFLNSSYLKQHTLVLSVFP